MAFDIDMIKEVYGKVAERVDKAREITGQPLTLAEKILYSHLWDGTPDKAFVRGKDYVDFKPDRIACQETRRNIFGIQGRAVTSISSLTTTASGDIPRCVLTAIEVLLSILVNNPGIMQRCLPLHDECGA